MVKSRIVFSFFFLFPLFASRAQVTGPEQDCEDAIPVCETLYSQTSSYSGIGSVNDINGHSRCLQNDENNSVWYIFTVTIPGRLEMSIIPNLNDDYDFAIYNITGLSCSDIFNGNAIDVRCNYAFTNGPTGLQTGFFSEVAGPGDSAFLRPLDVLLAETYVLVVDNFSSSSFGYTLDFNPGGASTASIVDFIPPQIVTVDPMTCDNTSSINIVFSEPILCSSLAADGSDFLVTDASAVPVTVIGALSSDCASGSFTSLATITLSSPITVGGTYNLIIKTGSDGGTVEDNCENQAVRDTITFFVPAIVDANYTYSISSSCAADTFSFVNTSTGNVISLLWDFGDFNDTAVNNPAHVFASVGTYSVQLSVSSADCNDTFISSVNALNSFIADFTFDPLEPCVGDIVTFTDVSTAAGTNYIWGFGDNNIGAGTTATNTYTAAGTYMVTLTVSDPLAPCSDSEQKPVLVREVVAAGFIHDSPACLGTAVNFTDNSSGAPATWDWDFGGGNTLSGLSVSFNFDSVGIYPVQLTVQDSFCGTDVVIENVSVLPPPVFGLSDTEICLSEIVILNSFPGADSTVWSTGETGVTIEFEDVPAIVWAIAYLGGCAYSDSAFIDEKTIDCSFAKVPTGFTPNGDGFNDFVKVFTKRVAEFEIIIFNRWGEEVYRSTGLNGGWDGTYKGEPLDIGAYTYLLEWKALNGERHVEKGSVTLIR